MGQRHVYRFGPQHVGGEFVFVPDERSASEGEGWLMGYVVDTATGGSELRILNAQAISEGPVATVHVPRRIPPGFHGNWMPDPAD